MLSSIQNFIFINKIPSPRRGRPGPRPPCPPPLLRHWSDASSENSTLYTNENSGYLITNTVGQ